MSKNCTLVCWEAVPCSVCGNELPPRGRDVGPEANVSDCCERERYVNNPRHLWSEHDDARFYTDPEGWAEHQRTCDRCRGEGS